MLIVALTGGIGSGKTTVADCFSDLGVPIISADTIAAQFTQRESPLLASIRQHFGDHYFDPEGNLLRAKLRALIFSDSVAKQWLENCLHPAIWVEIAKQIKTLSESPYCIIEIPLLVESKNIPLSIDRILVVDTPVEIQQARANTRDNVSAEKVIEQQATREARLNMADDIINNQGSLQALKAKVQDLHQKYLTL